MSARRNRGPGRPPLKAGVAKASILSIRCAPSERELIAAAARRAGAPSESEWARVILLAARPIRGRVGRYGQFVMNRPEEIVSAFRDYESGRLGKAEAPAPASR